MANKLLFSGQTQMRLKFKYVVMLGLVLAGVETWQKSTRPGRLDPEAEPVGIPPLKVYAKESFNPLAPLPAIAVTNWTEQAEAVFGAETSPTDQAITLLAMFPNLPPEEQTEAAHHVSRLLPDIYFGALGLQLTNSATAPTARRAIFADLLTRPNGIKLPWLCELARTAEESQAEEALFFLRAHFQTDYGQDWVAWRNHINTWIAQHPDELNPADSGIGVSN